MSTGRKLVEPFSEKQKAFIRTPLAPFNALWGTTGSGKSYIANIRMWMELTEAPKDALFLFTGNTAETLYDNVISHILSIDGRHTMEYVSKQGHQRLVCRNGVEAACVGANTENAQDRIFGKSVYMWYADEVQKQPSTFVEIAVSRCRWPIDGILDTHRPCVWTLNPDDATHTVKVNYIDRFGVLGGREWYFDFADNPTIQNPDKHRAEMGEKMTGVLRDRLVYGKWSASLNAIVPEFIAVEQDVVKDWPRPEYLDAYGALDPAYHDFTGYLVGYYDFKAAKYVIEDEFFVNKSNTQEIVRLIHETEARQFPQGMYLRVSDIEPILIADLNDLHGINIIPTRKDDKEAQINNLRVKTQEGRIIINPRCKNLIRQLRNGTWDKANKTFARVEGEGHFDMIDALIYFIRNVNTSRNPYPLLDKNVKIDDYYIDPKLLNKNTKDAQELAGALRIKR